MTVVEIFKKINAHMVEGLMLHDQMAQYYDFLNLHGYKRMHEYRFFCESAGMRGLNRYYINHYNKLLPEASVSNPEAIPANWYNYTRFEVDSGTKKRAIKDAFTKWGNWESSTKKLYEESYKELCEIGEVAAAMKVKELLSDVDNELKMVDRKIIKLTSIDYDLPTIYLCQDEIHSEYEHKTKEIGVNIC